MQGAKNRLVTENVEGDLDQEGSSVNLKTKKKPGKDPG